MLKFDAKLPQGRNPPLLCLCAVVHVVLDVACALLMIMVGSCLRFVRTMTWHYALVALWVTRMHCLHGSLAGALLVGLIIFLSPGMLFLKFCSVAFHKDGFSAGTRTISHYFCPYKFRPQRFRGCVFPVTLCGRYPGTLPGGLLMPGLFDPPLHNLVFRLARQRPHVVM
jgi:hypothetical protein